MSDRHEEGDVVAKRYRLERKLGEGGMGEVWAARHTVTRRQLALKLLKVAARSQAQRFVREARAASAVDHPNVVTVHDIFELDDGTPVMVMELLDGESLQERLDRDARLTIEQLADLMLPVVSAVGAAHALGIVHRDLKPENIFLARVDGVTRVKVLDFGIAKLAPAHELATGAEGITQTGALLGTPYYMSPEQACGERVDHRSDIWSLGIMFYQALSGVLPTRADSVGGVLKVVMTARIEPLAQRAPSLPEDVVSLVTRMLSEIPDDRPGDLREVQATLSRYSSVQVPSFPPAADGASGPSQPLQSHADPAMDTGTWLEHHLDGSAADTVLADSSELPAGADDSDALDPSSPRPGASTTAGAALTAAKPEGGASSRRVAIALVALGLVAVGAGLLAQTTRLPATAARASGWQAAGSVVPLHQPLLGLDAIAHYRTPLAGKRAALQSSDWWEAAAKDFGEAAKQPSAPPRWRAAERFAAAMALSLHGKKDEAAVALREAIEIDGSWSLAHAALAQMLAVVGDAEAAQAEAQEAQRLEPGWWGAVAAAARVHVQLDRLDEGIQEYRRALSMAPGAPTLLSELALTYHAARLDSEAVRYAEMALEADPDLVSVRLLLAERALEAGDADGALEQATRAVAVSPRDPASRLALADALALKGQREEAMAAYKTALELLEETGRGGAPEARVSQVRVALAAGELPPARGAQLSGEGTRSRKARARPTTRPESKPRSRPDTEGLDEYY